MNGCLICGKGLRFTNEVGYCTDCQSKMRNVGNEVTAWEFPTIVSITYGDNHKIVYITLSNGISYYPWEDIK